MNELIERKTLDIIQSTKDTKTLPPISENMKKYLPQVIEIIKKIREGKIIENQYKLAKQEIKMRQNSWNKVVDARVNKRAECQELIIRNIDDAQDINEKLALYDKWINIINSPLVNPEEI